MARVSSSSSRKPFFGLLIANERKVNMKFFKQPNLKRGARELFFLLGLIFTSETFGQITLTNIPTLGGTVISATDLNNVGQVVGFSRTAGDTAQHAFLFSGGVLSDLGTLGGRFSLASGINGAGQIIGNASITGDQEVHGFLINGETTIDFGTGTSVTAINEAGQVTGDSGQRAFLYSGGALRNLGTLGGS